MSVSQIVRHFEGLGKVPVGLDEVLGKVREFAGDEQIRVRAIDRDASELRAAIYRFKIEDGTTYMVPRMCSEIVYSTRMSLGWQRLACCKELLHILDPDPVCTSSQAQLLDLAEKMAGNQFPKPTSPNGLQALADQIAKWQAVAVLFPYGFYEEVLPKHEAGTISCEDVAGHLQLPPDIVQVALSPIWAHLRQTILAYS